MTCTDVRDARSSLRARLVTLREGVRSSDHDPGTETLSFDLTASGVALVAGFPSLLLLLVLLLGRLESWMLMPDERAATVTQLLDQVEEAEELEKAVALMMSEVADRPSSKKPSEAARRRAFRLARRRRA